MSCDYTQNILNGYVDGELDLVRSLEVEAHLEACPHCSKTQRDLTELRGQLRSPALYRAASPALAKRIHRAVRAEARPQRFSISPRWLMVPASAAIVAMAVWLAPQHTTDQSLAEQVETSHVRSLMANHLADVPSTDQHTVKPWFAGRLDFSPVVKDLAQDGFPLAGGRLDVVQGRPVAALVYKRRQHIINLFNWPSPGEAGPEETVRNGYNLIHWKHKGMAFWVVSDLNRHELNGFVELMCPVVKTGA